MPEPRLRSSVLWIYGTVWGAQRGCNKAFCCAEEHVSTNGVTYIYVECVAPVPAGYDWQERSLETVGWVLSCVLPG
eukprot:jgi/Botrbrau1/3450/Bobra.139_1s0030.1